MYEIERGQYPCFISAILIATSQGFSEKGRTQQWLELIMILGLEVLFASIAIILSVLSFKTLRDIRHLGVGKSFWIPVIASSVLFLMGSVLKIIHEVGLSLIAQTAEIVQVSRILALCILVCGIYSYSRRVKASLAEEFSIPQQIFEERSKMQIPAEDSLEIQALIQEKKVQENKIKRNRNSKKEVATVCKHRFGHLQTLPKNASIPDECLNCDKIIECKHSLMNTLETSASD